MDAPELLQAKMQARRALPDVATRRALRRGSGLTQADIAAWLQALGFPVTRESVARWESGHRTPRGELLGAYVEVLHQLLAEQP